MTRQGTLAYYLAAWVIGCFVVAVLQWVGGPFVGQIRNASTLLATYFLSLIFGAVAVLFFAFLLRRLMCLVGTHALWTWFLSGAVLSSLEILALIHARNALPSSPSKLGDLFAAVLLPGWVLEKGNFWQVPIDGAMTAWVLCLVDRAFSRPNETTTEPKHSPA